MTTRILHIRIRSHRQFFPEMKGGATVLLSGDASGIKMQVAYCNPEDVFCKKMGREYAAKAPVQEFPLRALPGKLGTIHREVHKRAHVFGERVNYDCKIRDFLPKE